MDQLKQKALFILVLALLSAFIACQDSKKSNLTLLSDQIPTDTPLIFGKDIVSTMPLSLQLLSIQKWTNFTSLEEKLKKITNYIP